MSEPSEDALSTQGSGRYRPGNARRAPPSGRGVGTTLLLALLAAGLTGAGWFIVNQQQQLVLERARVDDANVRLERLEERLMATDSALSQEGQDTKQQINLWESEIRKLWAVANERNRGWIKENQAQLKKINGTMDGIEASSRDLGAAVGRLESAFEVQQQLVDQLTSIELQVQQLVRAQRDLVDDVNAANQGLARVNTSLGVDVKDNSEAVAAFDGYRLAANKRLAQLEKRLARLTEQVQPVPVTPQPQ